MEKNTFNQRKINIEKKLAICFLVIAFLAFWNSEIYGGSFDSKAKENIKPQMEEAVSADMITVIIDPGHGGDKDNNEMETDESGWGAHYSGKYEKDLTLTTALAMKKELEKYKGVRVLLTRDEDEYASIKNRCDYAKENQADSFISLHYNASENHEFYGAETWVCAYGKKYTVGYGLANCFMNQLTDMGLTDRGIKTKLNEEKEDYYGIIRYLSEMEIPAILVEHCYMDDMGDFSHMDSKEKLENIGIRDAKAVADYYGLSQDEDKVTKDTVSAPVLKTAVMPDETAPSKVEIGLLSYDPETGAAKVKIVAAEEESRLLYYAFSLDKGKSFSRLETWKKSESDEAGQEPMIAWIQTRAGFSGKLMIEVWNNYDLSSLSNELTLNKSVRGEEESEVGTKGTYEFSKAYRLKEDLPEKIEKESEQLEEEVYGTEVGILAVLFVVLAGAWIGLGISMHIHKKRKKT